MRYANFGIRESLKNVSGPVSLRQKSARKRDLYVINNHDVSAWHAP